MSHFCKYLRVFGIKMGVYMSEEICQNLEVSRIEIGLLGRIFYDLYAGGISSSLKRQISVR